MSTPKKDYTDPLVHVKELVSSEMLGLAKLAVIWAFLPGPQFRKEALARSSGLKLIMDRFPEIDWGGGAKEPLVPEDAAKERRQTTPFPIPTGDTAVVTLPLGFKEDCTCPVCSQYRSLRDLADSGKSVH